MRLLFLVQRTAWFVEHDNAWYRLHDGQDVSLALSGLALRLINQHELVEQPHQAGSAYVSQLDESHLSFAFRSPDNRLLSTQTVSLDENVLLDVDWKTRPFGDGWLSSDVTLNLDNVGSFYVDAYLPPRDGSDGKTLTIANSSTGSSVDVWIARDRKSRLPIVEHSEGGRVSLRLSCEPEPDTADHLGDSRRLGFIMIEQEARLA